MNNEELESLEIQVKDFLNRCSEIKQKLSQKEEDVANSVGVSQEFAITK